MFIMFIYWVFLLLEMQNVPYVTLWVFLLNTDGHVSKNKKYKSRSQVILMFFF